MIYSNNSLEDFKLGDLVHVVNPTGGVRHDDVFSVCLAPLHRRQDKFAQTYVWVIFTGEPRTLNYWTKNPKPMGFDPQSLDFVTPAPTSYPSGGIGIHC